MSLFRNIAAPMIAGAILAGCALQEKPLSAPAKRLSEADALGSILPSMLASEYTAKICDGYTYENSLAVVDLDNARRVLKREAYTDAEFESGKNELMAIANENLQKDIKAGRYAPAGQYCPTLESAEVQQNLLGLRYLKKVR